MTDILLIQPPIRDFYLTAKRTIPYGLACIASSLIENGFSVKILDGLATSKSRPVAYPDELTYLSPYYGKPDLSPFALFHQYRHFGYSFQHMGNEAKKSGAFLVGISSLFTPYSREALKMAETVRRFHPDCKIVLGGHHPTALPETVMTCNHVDFVLRGEGEVSMPALAGALKQGTSLNTVPGIVFRKPDNALHISEPVFMDTPDDYPLPAINLINQKFYRRGKKGSTVVVTSRGCPMKCSYCSLGSSSVTYRRRNIDAVIREIDTAVKNNQAGFIDFEDENLSLEKPWFMNLLREITHRFHEYDIELRAMNGLFPPSLDEEIISAMKQAGFKTLNLSLGSTSGRQLARFNRPDVRKSLEKALSLAAKYHLQSVSYVIAGAPFQRPGDSISDLVYLAGKNTIAGVSIFYPSPESADYRLCEKAGILPENFSMMRSSAIPLSHTTTRTESVTLLRLGRIVNFMKSLADVGIPVPEPCSYTEQKVLAVKDRTKTGKLLLSWFLYDGKIRGVTDDEEIYDHEISTRLTRLFIKKMLNGKNAEDFAQ